MQAAHLLVSVSFPPEAVHRGEEEGDVSSIPITDEGSASGLRGQSCCASDTLWAAKGFMDVQSNLSAEHPWGGPGWVNALGKRTICQKHVICTNLMAFGDPV